MLAALWPYRIDRQMLGLTLLRRLMHGCRRVLVPALPLVGQQQLQRAFRQRWGQLLCFQTEWPPALWLSASPLLRQTMFRQKAKPQSPHHRTD